MTGLDGPLLVENGGGVAWLTFNRPERHNALDRQLGDALLQAALQAAADPSVRCIVLGGTGGRFCAGDDIATLEEFLDKDDLRRVAVMANTRDAVYIRVCEALLQAPKPVIAAIDGVAAGAGIELACAADLRVASTAARLGSGLINVGQLGTAALLGRVVGSARATELYLTGRLVDADEAHRIGLVDLVVETDRFAAEVQMLATTMAARPTAVIGQYKELRERIAGQPIEAALRLQDAYHVRTHSLEDSSEGLRAFLDRREPRFSGR